jgi:hypothetical protein
MSARQFLALIWLVAAAGQGISLGAETAAQPVAPKIDQGTTAVSGVVVPAGAHPALVHVERGFIEMRTDPEASKRDAEEALRLLQKQPDADLEVQARLLLCDYQAERDTKAAELEIEAGMQLLPKAQR